MADYRLTDLTNTATSTLDADLTYLVSNTAGSFVDYQISIKDITKKVDNQKLFFGTGEDATIYYNGSHLAINPKDVGTGQVRVLGAVAAKNGTLIGSLADSSNGAAGYFTDSGLTAKLVDAYQAGYFSDGSSYAKLAISGYAGIFDYGSNQAILGTTNQAGYFADGYRLAKLADGTNAGYFNYGTRTATFTNINWTAYFSDGTTKCGFGDGTAAAYFADGAYNYASLADGTQAAYFKYSTNYIAKFAVYNMGGYIGNGGLKAYFSYNGISGSFTDGTSTTNLADGARSITANNDIAINADSKKALFGAGQDASIYYDGTDLYINPKEVGTGKVKVSGSLDSTNGTFTAGLADVSNGAGHFVNGTYLANLATSSNVAGYFTDTTNIVYLSDGTRSITTNSDIAINADSKKMYFGAGQDAYIEFDGNSLNIDTNGVTSTDELNLDTYRVHIVAPEDATGSFTGTHKGQLTLEQSGAFTADDRMGIGFSYPAASEYIIGKIGSRITASGSWLEFGTSSSFASGINKICMTMDYNPHIYLPNDNEKLYFGAGNDCTIYYDGTDMIVNSDDVGSGGCKINTLNIRADGTIQPVQLADGSASNDSIYYSTTQSKLVYKDSGGTVNNLY